MSNEIIIFGLSIVVLTILAFFLFGWLSKKLIKNIRIRKPVTWIATLLIAPIIYITLILTWIFVISFYPTHEFNKTKWDSDKEKRYEMSEDIIMSKILIGKTKQDVIKILGDEGNSTESDYWYYYLGFIPKLMSIDSDVLTIKFINGRVTLVSQHET